MADHEDFQVFISWSGPLAKSIASALDNWLPTMFDHIDVWFSDTDIPAGTAWFGDIQQRLNSSDYGIVVVTTENLNRPWMNFESGALSKKLKQDVARVTPVLVNFTDITQLTGHPLQQYNAVLLDEDGIRKLCDSIARSAGRNTASVMLRFRNMWPDLEAEIDKAKKSAGTQPEPPDVSEPEVLESLSASVRSLESTVARLVRNYVAPSSPTVVRQPARRPASPVNNINRVVMQVAEIVGRYRHAGMKDVNFLEDGSAEVAVGLAGPELTEVELAEIQAAVGSLPVPITIVEFDYWQ
ncbi:toll/interleukin-1 receptor domain-containing protein [Mycobacterium asiaticum]|uniref:TIR domain-containing protein n=1 Tax=Mycobacterium asiaticum TaxID=1790 RepID=A0A1A3KQ54_MYCAS|nr:toll/interleukin-1 receptor domain-containing protein [Mycobacterium asiaticum]OBJ86508.1 hypothetical protein A5640_11120 [Mycobacterium asiaticum]